MSYRGRFAPSPSGPLHFGSLVAAAASFLDARANRGTWLVRIEDVDTPRTAPGAEGEILRTLDSLGLHWDESVMRQSARGPRYREALEALRRAGRVYRCKCSRREIEDSAVAGVEGPVYPGTCRALRLGPEVEGAERFRVAPGVVAFDDRVMGCIEQDLARDVGDFVVRRRDGLFAYQLAVVVDDADQGITDVVRGADLLLSTPRQVALQRALDLPTPRYLHVPVATDSEGRKLSKQTHAAAIEARSAGESLAQALRFLGQAVPEGASVEEMLRSAIAAWRPMQIPRQRAAAVTFRDRPRDGRPL